jgi:hypothetical protein
VSSAKNAFLPLGVAAVGAVGVEELAQGETVGGFRRTVLRVDGHR